MVVAVSACRRASPFPPVRRSLAPTPGAAVRAHFFLLLCPPPARLPRPGAFLTLRHAPGSNSIFGSRFCSRSLSLCLSLLIGWRSLTPWRLLPVLRLVPVSLPLLVVCWFPFDVASLARSAASWRLLPALRLVSVSPCRLWLLLVVDLGSSRYRLPLLGACSRCCGSRRFLSPFSWSVGFRWAPCPG